jgi:nucleoside-diphosphate-sugar epimerase
LTKKLGEEMCRFYTQRYGLSTLCLRPGGICARDAPLQRRLNHLFGVVDVRDVAQAHVLALEAPRALAHDTFVITADSPLCAVEPTQFFADRMGVLERLFPGIQDLIEAEDLNISGPVEWYTIAKAKRLLGYAPRSGFVLPAGGEAGE